MDEDSAPAVDVVFDLVGTSLPVEHALPLWNAVRAVLPWLEAEAGAGIHPLRTSVAPGGEALLARRAKFVLRVPRERGETALGLAGCTLSVAGRTLGVGAGTLRPLKPWATLHAQRVTLGTGDDVAFQVSIAQALAALGVGSAFITGRRRSQVAAGRAIEGFSVALVDVTPAESLRVQCAGIGGERGLGWGIFLPHKAIAAAA